MKVKAIYRREILRSVLAVLAALFVLLLLISCAEPEQVEPKKQEFTFYVYSLDRSVFSARIDWGVDGLQDKERVTSWGFASSVKLRPGEELVLLVDRPGLAVRVTRNTDGAGGVFTLSPGERLAVNPFAP